MQRPKIHTRRNLVLILFGLPFFLVGAGFLLLSVIPTFWDFLRMADWPSVPGTLLQAELTSSQSDGSTTYGTEARYSYRVGGRTYHNDRVAINSGSDNIGSFQQDLGHELEQMARMETPVPVYYDPDDPADSVLNRDLRWGLLGLKLIFVLVFGGLGAGLIYWGYHGRKTLVVDDAEQAPWLTRPEWQGGVIRSGAKKNMIGIWLFAAFWNSISAPAAFQFPEIWEQQGNIALLVLVFPIIGAILIYAALKVSREWWHFGVTPLTLDPFPGAIGGDVGGSIRVKTPYQPGMIARVTLSSIHSYVTGSGKNRHRREKIEWQDDGYASIQPGTNALELQFRFAVPTGLTPSEEPGNSYHLWRLQVELETDGMDLDRSFEIPVYATGERSARITIDSTQERPAGMESLTAESLLPLRHDGNRKLLFYPMFRKPLASLGLLSFGSIFAGAGYFLWLEAREAGFMLYLMSTVFGLFGWGMILAALYSAFHSRSIALDGDRVRCIDALLGFPIRQTNFRYSEVLAIEATTGLQTSQGQKQRIQYRIVARLADRKVTLAEGLDSARKRDLVIAYLQRELLKRS